MTPSDLSRPARRTSARRATALAGCVLLLLAVFMVGFELNATPGVAIALKAGQLADAQKEAIKVMLDLFQLLMSWAVALIGATAFFLKLHLEKSVELRQVDLYLSLAIICCCVLSLYFGHLAVNVTADLLGLFQFPLQDERLNTVGRCQYIAFFTAVMLFGLHIFQFFWIRLDSSTSGSPA